MAVKLKLQGLEPVPVDLNGTEFNAVPATKPVVEKLDDAWRAYFEAEGVEKTVAALEAVFDLRLEPLEGAKVKASKVMRDMWDAGQVTLPQLVGFLNDAAAEADRPTPQQ